MRMEPHLHPIYMRAKKLKKYLKEGWDHGTMGPFRGGDSGQTRVVSEAYRRESVVGQVR